MLEEEITICGESSKIHGLNSTKYSLNHFSQYTAKHWNALPDNLHDML